jgi:hypothetical protein
MFLKDAALEMQAPYQFLHHHRELLQTYSQSARIPLQRDIEAVLRYINTNYGHEYAEAEKLISQRMITTRHLDKIFRPNHLIEFSLNRNNRQVSVVKDWPQVHNGCFEMRMWT